MQNNTVYTETDFQIDGGDVNDQSFGLASQWRGGWVG